MPEATTTGPVRTLPERVGLVGALATAFGFHHLGHTGLGDPLDAIPIQQ